MGQQRFIVISLFWLVFCISPAWGEGFIDRREILLSPSFLSPGELSKATFYFSCYDIETLRLLDCAFTHKVIGLKPPPEDVGNNGGHTHNYDTHPLIEPRDGSLAVAGGQFEYINNLWINGQTRNGVVVVTHPTPQVSGKIATESILTAPYGWVCVRNCYTYNSWRWERPLDVGVGGLEPLLPSGQGYWRLTGQTTVHPDNHYGTSSTKGTLALIGLKYFEETGRSLGINDMSLPKGGMFDLNNQWWVSNTPGNGHVSHRTGTDADIDRGGINCLNDEKLRKAIEIVNKYGYVAGGQPKVKLKCESGGRKHIDFD